MKRTHKITALIFCTAMLLLLGGCSSDEPASSESSGTLSGSSSAEGYTFTFRETTVTMGEEADPVIESLGEDYDYFESESCAFDGLDKVYTYPGFKLNTYPIDDVDYILSIVFRDDTVETEEGITIGSSRESVLDVYGDPSDETSFSLIYKKGNTVLTFGMTSDAVATVTIAEDTN